MSTLYIDVLCAESDRPELIDGADAILGISDVLGVDSKWYRLSVGCGSDYDRDIRFYDPRASNETTLSAEEVNSHLHRCASRGLRRCSVDTVLPQTDDAIEECLQIRLHCQEFRPFKVEPLRRRLRAEIHIIIEPAAFFFSRRQSGGEWIGNEEPWVDWLMQIFMSIGRCVKPRTMHMYFGDEWALPVNSHFAYFASPREVIEDIELLRMAWTQGLTFNTPPSLPFGRPEGFRELMALSPYRDHDACELVTKQFSTAFAARATVTEEDVRRALESKRFDTLTPETFSSECFAVTDYPWFLETWLDRFYLDVLGYPWWEKENN